MLLMNFVMKAVLETITITITTMADVMAVDVDAITDVVAVVDVDAIVDADAIAARCF